MDPAHAGFAADLPDGRQITQHALPARVERRKFGRAERRILRAGSSWFELSAGRKKITLPFFRNS
jgi:hypothetical protein